jgi:hypothetical protein
VEESYRWGHATPVVMPATASRDSGSFAPAPLIREWIADLAKFPASSPDSCGVARDDPFPASWLNGAKFPAGSPEVPRFRAF